MSQPTFLVIGDDFPFELNNVRDDEGANLPSATATWELVDKASRTSISSGSMSQYDTDPSSFEASIPSDGLQLYDAEDNPDGLVINREYVLRVRVSDGSNDTTHVVGLTAVLDPPEGC